MKISELHTLFVKFISNPKFIKSVFKLSNSPKKVFNSSDSKHQTLQSKIFHCFSREKISMEILWIMDWNSENPQLDCIPNHSLLRTVKFPDSTTNCCLIGCCSKRDGVGRWSVRGRHSVRETARTGNLDSWRWLPLHRRVEKWETWWTRGESVEKWTI